MEFASQKASLGKFFCRHIIIASELNTHRKTQNDCCSIFKGILDVNLI